MGWAFALAFVLVALAALWRFGKLPRAGIEFALAAALVAVAGYAWQGRPAAPASPVTLPEGIVNEDSAAIATRQRMTNGFGSDAQWIGFADALDRMGATRSAVTAIKSGLKKNPNSVDLWVALGTALVRHGGNSVSPAAEFAFRRAAQLSPQHPGPPFFLGLALVQSGRTEDGLAMWQGLLARTPKDSPWRADLEQRIGELSNAPPGNG